MRGGALNAIQASLWPKDKITEISQPAEELLGMAGRMLYISRGIKKPPTIFNANIFNEKGKKIWFGDIDINRDKTALFRLSARLGYIYILYGMESRLLRHNPSIWELRKSAAVIIEEGNMLYSKNFAEKIMILKNG